MQSIRLSVPQASPKVFLTKEERGKRMLLAGKTAVISGAASARGIGLATARLFAEHGARVAIVDLSEEASAATADGLGPQHRGYACDVTDAAACRDAIARILGEFGGVDILINNAGISQPLKLMEIEAQHWEAVLDANLRGVLYLSQAVIPHMRSRRAGSIACMSSVSAQRGGGIFGGPHYSAAKAGVLGLAKAMARELGPDGIRVNCVTPGLIQTDITGGKLTTEMKTEILKGIPLNRLGDTIDVARIFLFLASDLSGYVTGATIDVNGGMLIHG
jgi:NAD(P)-dependent dehydrogenase (short-subunit alcohol dehydrogenase family)